MKILFIGDIFGKPGRDVARRAIPSLVEQRGIDFVIANVENSAAGFGVTGDIAETILSYGRGRHDVRRPRVGQEGSARVHSAPAETVAAGELPRRRSGRGSYLGRTRTGEPIGVINLIGRVFMTPLDDPFAVALREIENLRARRAIIFVDFHAEATSEKVAMGWHFDGRVTAVVGTHTHVQTADERILPEGHGLSDRRRHDRSARLGHRRHESRRRSAGFSPRCPRGSRRPPDPAG